ncbi:MAG: hypothetical protein WA728_30915 [Xanthobacteraceae bacterium]
MAINGNDADQLAFLEHRHTKQSSRAGQSRKPPAPMLWLNRKVGDMNQLFGRGDSAEGMFRAGPENRLALSELSIGARYAVRCYVSEPAALMEFQCTKLSLANSGRVIQD